MPCAACPAELPVHDWTRPADHHDDALLAECVGDTLDIGCGPGRLAQRLAERGDRRTGRRVLGIDVVARKARNMLNLKMRRHHARRASGEQVPIQVLESRHLMLTTCDLLPCR